MGGAGLSSMIKVMNHDIAQMNPGTGANGAVEFGRFSFLSWAAPANDVCALLVFNLSCLSLPPLRPSCV